MENLTLTEATSLGKRALRGFKIVKNSLDSSAWSVYVMTKDNIEVPLVTGANRSKRIFHDVMECVYALREIGFVAESFRGES